MPNPIEDSSQSRKTEGAATNPYAGLKNEAAVKKEVKRVLFEIEQQIPIYTMCPMTFGYGESGHPDRILVVRGKFIAIESKHTSDTCLLRGGKPRSKSEVFQRKQLLKIIKAGGIPMVPTRDNLVQFIQLMRQISGCSISEET